MISIATMGPTPARFAKVMSLLQIGRQITLREASLQQPIIQIEAFGNHAIGGQDDVQLVLRLRDTKERIKGLVKKHMTLGTKIASLETKPYPNMSVLVIQAISYWRTDRIIRWQGSQTTIAEQLRATILYAFDNAISDGLAVFFDVSRQGSSWQPLPAEGRARAREILEHSERPWIFVFNPNGHIAHYALGSSLLLQL